MKFLPLILMLFTAALPRAYGQLDAVTVQLSVDQEQFLSNEDVRVAVKVVNLSGQTITLGTDRDWLDFTVQARDQFVVSQIGDVPVVGEFSVPSSKQAIKRVNIMPYFDFRQPGRYTVTAKVKIAQWDKEISSPPLAFDVIMGTKLKEFDFGVPGTPANKLPEMRRYVLQQATFMRQMRLYLRVTDSTGAVVFRVQPLCPMTSFSKPEAQLDHESNLHVLNQSGARSFTYCVINPAGEIVKRQIHDYSDTRPVLRPDERGGVYVAGGTVRLTSNDPTPSLSTPQAVDKDAQKN